MMVSCCLKSFTAIKVDGQPNCAVEYDPVELLQFIGQSFLPMNVMCERAEMSEQFIYDRTKEIFDYFGLPFDTAQPG